MVRHPGHEFLQRRSRGRPVGLSDRHVGGQLDDAESGFRRLLGDGPPDQRDVLPAHGILGEQPARDLHALVDPAALQQDLGNGEQKLRIAAGGLDGEVLGGRRHGASFHEHAREVLLQRGVGRVEARRLAKADQRLLRLSHRLELRRDRLELRTRGRTLARPGEVAGRQIRLQQPRANVLVVGAEHGGLAQRLDGFRVAALLCELRGERLVVAKRARRVVHVEARSGRGEPRRVVGRIERAQPDPDLRDPQLVSAAAPPLADGVQVRARIRQQTQAARDLGALQERVLVVRLDLVDLLVEGARLGQETLLAQHLGDADELIDGLVDLACARVQIAEDVARVPVAREFVDDPQIFRNRQVQLSLPEQLLSVAQCCSAVDRHRSNQSIVSKSVAGRNDRRCASE